LAGHQGALARNFGSMVAGWLKQRGFFVLGAAAHVVEGHQPLSIYATFLGLMKKLHT